MTPAPVWSRLLVSLTSCALMALGLRDMLAPGLVLQSVPGDAQLQAVWGSLGEGWARQHAQHIAGAGDGVGTHGDAFLRPHPHLREQCEPPPRNAVSLAQWEREREGGAPRGRANNRGCVPRGVALLMLHGWRRADGPRWGWSQPVVRQRSSRSSVGRAPVTRHGRGAASLSRPQT